MILLHRANQTKPGGEDVLERKTKVRIDRDRGKKRGVVKNESESETQGDMLDIMMMTEWGKKNTGSDRDRTGEPQTQKVEVLCGQVCVY